MASMGIDQAANSPLLTPTKLRHLASDKLTQMLQRAVNKMNTIIAADINAQAAKSARKEKSSKSKSRSKSKSLSKSGEPKATPIAQSTCAKAAVQMMRVRRYLMNTNCNYNENLRSLTPEVVQHIIATAIDTGNIGMIRLVVSEWTNMIDFRALETFLCRHDTKGAENSSHANSLTVSTPLEDLFQPPNEFDWFSRDRVGKIMKMHEACELFSIVGMSMCAKNVKEFYLNAGRPEYWSCSPETMELATSVLSLMKNLTTLVLRGCCDDYMVQIIGKTATKLKHFDISGSHFVTDAGLKGLFFKDVIENPATYLMKSFIDKNLKNMNPLVNTLETLDCSWTNVTALTRKMVHYLPGAFVFKRVFALGENYAHGHHIFLRKKAIFQSRIPATNEGTSTSLFESSLASFITDKNAKAFMKFTDQHPWKNCLLYLYDSEEDEMKNINYMGIITPNDEERRVYGIFKHQGVLTEMYSVFPVNLNILGDSCPKLQIFRGTVTDVWKMKSSLLTDLTELDMFADPATTTNVLEYVPNLKKVRIRILKQQLTDDHIIKTTFMCCRTLEELWIAPGTYKSEAEETIVKTTTTQDVDSQWKSFNEVHANYYAGQNPPRVKHNIANNNDKNSCSSELEVQECQIEDLVRLSPDCIRTLLKSCPKLIRMGDIAWWSVVSEEELKEICQEMRKDKKDVNFIWENQIFSSRQ